MTEELKGEIPKTIILMAGKTLSNLIFKNKPDITFDEPKKFNIGEELERIKADYPNYCVGIPKKLQTDTGETYYRIELFPRTKDIRCNESKL
jgi:hypothetical protein